MRCFGILALMLALTSSCRETNKSDAGSSREEETAKTATRSPEDIGKLFAEATDCPNRYRCPPLDELLRRVSTPAARSVVTGAFDLMAAGKIRSIDRGGEFTNMVVREWLLERRNTGTLDPETAAWSMAQIQRAVATGHPSLVGGLQLLALNAKLPGALDWVEKDITEAGKPLEGACIAGRFLSSYLDDYARVERWLATAGDNGLAGAICSLHRFDHDLFSVERNELPLLERAAGRPSLPPEITYPLLDHIEIHRSDARFRAIARKLTRHADDGVRKRAATLAQ